MIIGISGKIGSGKDTIGKIIQYLTDYTIHDYSHPITEKDFNSWIKNKEFSKYWKIKKFSDKLKDVVCLFIDCTRKQLEDQEFKNKELGEEWWYYIRLNKLESYLENKHFNYTTIPLVKLTPRKLLQLLGTECGRDIIHPNIWVNSLFSDYKASHDYNMCSNPKDHNFCLPNWIITDMRFPNELKVVEGRGGITIRVNRTLLKNLDDDIVTSTAYVLQAQDKKNKTEIYHPSETALDNAEFDYTINNNGTIEELIEKVKEILIKENLI